MPAVPSRRVLTAGSLSLALALGMPAAAFADHGEPHAAPAAAAAQEDAGPLGTPPGLVGETGSPQETPPGLAGQTGGAPQTPPGQTGAPQTPPGQGISAATPPGLDGQPRSSATPPGQDARDRPAATPPGLSGGARPAPGAAAGAGDPRGNNGTIKIDGEGFDDGRGNEPHVGCVFRVDFFGFDAGDTATLTITGIAPTGGGELYRAAGVPISDDAAGGGQDADASLLFSVDDQLAALRALEPAAQGWHVKVAVDVDGAPGGAKQKVLWIDCPAAPAAEVTGTTAEGERATDERTVEQPPTERETAAGPARPGVVQQPARSAGIPPMGPLLPATPVMGPQVPTQAVQISGGAQAPATAAGPQPQRPRPDAQVLAAAGSPTFGAATVGPVALGAGRAVTSATASTRATRPAELTLPFTGSHDVAVMLALALGALGLGGLAQRLGRTATR